MLSPSYIDIQLWRSLYLRTYASASTRRQALSGIPVSRSRSHSSRPWKDLYKISTNWRNGSAKSSTTILTNTVRKSILPPIDSMVLPPIVDHDEEENKKKEQEEEEEEDEETLIEIYQQYFISCSKTPSTSSPPLISISHSLPQSSGQTQLLTTIHSSRLEEFYSIRRQLGVGQEDSKLSITELRLDNNNSPQNSSNSNSSNSSSKLLSVFYSTGQFSIFRLTFPSNSTTPFHSQEVYTSLSISATPFDPISLARLHYPLLVTCSTCFTIRFYQLDSTSEEEEGGLLQVKEIETPLQSKERWAPVVLGIEKVRKNEGTFKVSLVYSLPVFPNDWTVGLQGKEKTTYSLLKSIPRN